jgi:hypothetical protein
MPVTGLFDSVLGPTDKTIGGDPTPGGEKKDRNVTQATVGLPKKRPLKKFPVKQFNYNIEKSR